MRRGWTLGGVFLLMIGWWGQSGYAFNRLWSERFGLLTWPQQRTFSYSIFSKTHFDGLDQATFVSIVAAQYEVWRKASRNQVRFVYKGLSDLEVSYQRLKTGKTKTLDSIHTHQVIKTDWRSFGLSSAAIAVTLIYTDKDTIKDADIIYNDQYFDFCHDASRCYAWEMHLPTIVLHEMGHQLGFDHTKDQSSVMHAYINSRTTKNLNIEDQEGAVCSYAKANTDEATFLKACALAEGEGSIGGADVSLSNVPPDTLSCATLRFPTGSKTRRPPPVMLILLVILMFALACVRLTLVNHRMD